jgi:Nucleoside-diphosphate-sugar epimerases
MKLNTNFWSGKKVLVTGHTGFKGAWLVVFLKHLGCNVSGVSDKKYEGIYKLSNISNLLDEEYFIDLSEEDNEKILKIHKNFNPEYCFSSSCSKPV